MKLGGKRQLPSHLTWLTALTVSNYFSSSNSDMPASRPTQGGLYACLRKNRSASQPLKGDQNQRAGPWNGHQHFRVTAYLRALLPPEGGSAQIHGTGLGLSLAKRLALAMGGRLSVVSEVGVGSIFTLHLPRRGGTGMRTCHGEFRKRQGSTK